MVGVERFFKHFNKILLGVVDTPFLLNSVTGVGIVHRPSEGLIKLVCHWIMLLGI